MSKTKHSARGGVTTERREWLNARLSAYLHPQPKSNRCVIPEEWLKSLPLTACRVLRYVLLRTIITGHPTSTRIKPDTIAAQLGITTLDFWNALVCLQSKGLLQILQGAKGTDIRPDYDNIKYLWEETV